MASTGLVFKFSADMKQFRSAMDNAVKSISAVGKQMKGIGQTMSTYITAPLVGIGGVAVANAVKFEKLSTSLDVLTGSAEAGAAAFERLREYSASTPFQLDQLVQVNNMLLGFGLSTDQAFKSLQMLGDVASVSGADLDRVARAFGQSAAAGRVMTEDLNQFVDNGIPIYQLLGDVTGKNAGELRKLASDGQITFDILNAAFAKATSQGGTFFEGTSKLSKTLGGRISTLTDNFNLMMGSVGQIIGEFLSPLIDILTSLFKKFDSLSDTTKKWTVIIAGTVAAIGPLLFILGSLLTMAPMVATAIAAIKAAFIAFGVAIKAVNWEVVAIAAVILGLVATGFYLYDNWNAVIERLKIAWVKLKLSIADSAYDMLAAIGKVASALGQTGLSATITGMLASFKKIDVAVPETTTKFKTFGETFDSLKAQFFGFSSGAQEVVENVDEIGISADKSNQKMFDLGKALEPIKTMSTRTLDDAFKPIEEGIKNSQKWLDKFGKYHTGVIEKMNGETTSYTEKWRVNLASSLESFNAFTSNISGLISTFFQSWGMLLDNQLAKEDLKKEASILKIDEMVAADVLTVEEGEKRKAKVVADYEKKKNELKVKAFKAEKARAVIGSIIATALAVTQSLPNLLLAGLVGAMGAVQTGIIASQPIPAFANGGLVFGPTMGLVGEGPGTTRSNPEVIAPLDKLASMMGGGVNDNITVSGVIRGEDIYISNKLGSQSYNLYN